MYKIMIVDDEPPIIRSTRRIIEKSSLCFEVVAEAYNGVEALDKIALHKPDIVLVDIKMPVMDGLALIKNINRLYPNTISVIISGYQDFEFARQGLKLGVFDYLLKPIEPELMCKLLESLFELLQHNEKAKSGQALYKLIYSSPEYSGSVPDKYAGCEYFFAALIRKGSIPYHSSTVYQYSSEIQLIGPEDKDLISSCIPFDNFWFFEGVDANELLLILGYSSTEKIKEKKAAEAIYSILYKKMSPITVVYTPCHFELSQLRENFKQMQHVMNRCLVIGKPQLLRSSDSDFLYNIPAPLLSSSLEKKLCVLLQGRSVELIKGELVKLFQNWEQNAYPQIWVEKMLKQILRIVEKNSSIINSIESLNNDRALEDVISLSTDFNGLLCGVWDIIQEIISMQGVGSNTKEDSLALMHKIEKYISTNLSQPVSLQCVCDLFGISQPYLSRLFRKHKNLSFNEFLTHKRIDEAKRLLDENCEMLLKDIAEIVGYPDQHYFSRIFKAITGLSPSEYKRRLPSR